MITRKFDRQELLDYFFNFVLGTSSATGDSRLGCICGNISLLF